MTPDELAQRRRQAYWRRRRQFEATKNRGALLATERMTSEALSMAILEALTDISIRAEDAKSPELWSAAMNGLKAYHELVMRGEQLLLPL